MEEKIIYEEDFELIAERANLAFDSLDLTNNYVVPNFELYSCGNSDYIVDITNMEEVIKWIIRYFDSGARERLESEEYSSAVYDSIVQKAIKANVPDIVNVLHRAFYVYNRGSPDYTEDLKIAASHSDIKTFKLVFYNFFKGYAYDGVLPMTRKEFEDCVLSNPNRETRNWIGNHTYDIYNIFKFRLPDW
jgi:hypothetical protein